MTVHVDERLEGIRRVEQPSDVVLLALLGVIFAEVDPLAVDLDQSLTATPVQPVLGGLKDIGSAPFGQKGVVLSLFI